MTALEGGCYYMESDTRNNIFVPQRALIPLRGSNMSEESSAAILVISFQFMESFNLLTGQNITTQNLADFR
jgi:hypothetical protein